MPVPTLLRNVDTSKLRRHCSNRWQFLTEARQPWLDFTRQVAQELLPNRLPYLLDPHTTQKGGEQNTHIVDAVGHLSVTTAASGIHNGVMPNTSKWFELVIRNQFGDDVDQKLYLEENQRRLLSLHNQSNAGNVLPQCQEEWLAFGTGAALILEDDEDGYRLDGLSVGEYCIAEDARGRVDTLYRKLTLTVGQLVEEFGVENLSPSSQQEAALEHWDTPVPCLHCIEPDRDGRNPEGNNPDLPWRSVYYEDIAQCNQVLAVRGFHKFPALVWRWGKLPGSPYGYGRGHEVLPHLVRLSKLIYRYGQALAEKADPAVQVPPGIQQHEVRRLPGGVTSVFGQQPITNLRKIDLELKEVAEWIEQTKQDIRDTIGATLVQSLRQITHQMTAREVSERSSQNLTEFLPALARLNDELLAPYIEWLWDIAEGLNLLPPTPESLTGQIIDIEFTSPLARKQRQAEADAIVRTFAVAGEIAKVPGFEDVVDHLDVGTAIRRISEIEGAPVSIIVPIEQVRQIQAARARTQQAQATAAAAQQGADFAKTASEAQPMAAVA